MSSQLAMLATGSYRATNVSQANIGAAASHFGPSTTNVKGLANASSKPVNRNVTTAAASCSNSSTKGITAASRVQVW